MRNDLILLELVMKCQNKVMVLFPELNTSSFINMYITEPWMAEIQIPKNAIFAAFSAKMRGRFPGVGRLLGERR